MCESLKYNVKTTTLKLKDFFSMAELPNSYLKPSCESDVPGRSLFVSLSGMGKMAARALFKVSSHHLPGENLMQRSSEPTYLFIVHPKSPTLACEPLGLSTTQNWVGHCRKGFSPFYVFLTSAKKIFLDLRSQNIEQKV